MKPKTLATMHGSTFVGDGQKALLEVAQAIKEGGVDVIEFTMTTPGALDIIEKSSVEFGTSVLLGAGTVLDAETAAEREDPA